MPHSLVTVPVSRKALKRLPKQIRETLVKQIQGLSENPYLGESLKPPFEELRSYHSRLDKTDYRIVYFVNQSQSEIVIIFVASRENFYRQLRRLNLKQLLSSIS